MSELNIDQLDPSGDIRTVAEDAGAWDPAGTRRQMLKRAGIGGAGLAAGSTLLGGFLSPLEAFAASSSAATGQYSTKKKSLANDVKIGNYALTLEYLEAAFYDQASKGGALTDPDIARFAKTVAKHEADHVTGLKKILGKYAVKSPTVDFKTAVTDQTTFIKTAAVIEPVGTAAYAGAAPYIHTLSIAKAAFSIHSVEANHAAWAAALLNWKGIDTSILPAANSFNPVLGYQGTLKTVGKTGFVTGGLNP
jgi:rubrerythrin